MSNSYESEVSDRGIFIKSNKARSLLILLATLMIGCLLGVLTVGMVVRDKVQTARQFTQKEGFVLQIESVLKPSVRQQPKLNPILNRYSEKVQGIFALSRTSLQLEMDAMMEELSTVVSEQQLDRLEHRRS
ncbi:hypothetical protein [Endozoicomonas numazuensis]|uniref:Chemotaxis methyl-accepting receptor HlyB-like 4HB MCP domain-containing protein n=1 Tax=Endozoicomonas numazuensis TaxID=1137799 RepID=A0A081N3V8_9GAMM|nr:hypothetical protein [Endozoicomonas numazuensis]KEQ13131.1 hypothetical protein GZ78_26650 [Endozoicomonas numazuensis]